MKQRKLGASDLSVSLLCLGTMQFGWTTGEDESFAVMDAYLAAGGNFIDTADMYSSWAPGNPGGVSEEIIGRWLKKSGKRSSIVLATKLRARMWDGPDGEGLSRSHVMRAVDDSLRRMQVDVIDLYQCHWPDEVIPLEETISALHDVVRAGKVRYVGLSNYDPAQTREAIALSEKYSGARVVSQQPPHSLVRRKQLEAELLATCIENEIGVIPYSPLAGGFLTGKYREGAPLPETARASSAKKYATAEGFRVVEALEGIARAREVSIAAVALAWQLGKAGITSSITGANTPAQLADLLPAASIELDANETRALDDVSRPFL
jgi:aryl-alcohol dehydrogenase-like predicted oxidoreductase